MSITIIHKHLNTTRKLLLLFRKLRDKGTQQTMANRFASESDPLNLLSCSNFQPKTSSVYVMKVYPSSDT